MIKCIATLIWNGDRFENGNTYKSSEIKDVAPEIVEQCFISVDEEKSEAIQYETMNVDELKEALTALDIEIPENSKKKDLLNLLKQN